jgi:beta-lactam-binding protein with PASTA domain
MPRWFGAKRRATGGAGRAAAVHAASASAPGGGARRRPLLPRRPFLRWLAWLVIAVAVMTTGGYLVAALWLFPGSLLPTERQVARVSGMGEGEARRELERQQFQVAVEREPHPRVPAGTVVWQEPPPGAAIPRSSTVTITVSSGYTRVAVPVVAGLEEGLATRLLVAAGLRLEGVDSTAAGQVPAGVAVGTVPAAGDSVLMGRGVLLRLSRGQP